MRHLGGTLIPGSDRRAVCTHVRDLLVGFSCASPRCAGGEANTWSAMITPSANRNQYPVGVLSNGVHMQFSLTSLRTVAIASVLGAAALSAQAGLTIPINATVSDSVQAFPEKVMRAFKAVDIKVEARGTASALDAPGIGGSSSQFNLPVTRIVLGFSPLVQSGSAVGSALFFSRLDFDDNFEEFTSTLTLANFTLDYKRQLVLADTTHSGKPTMRQLPIYKFNTATRLNLRYRFPLSISLYEQLNKLYLTPEAQAAFRDGLKLPGFAEPSLTYDYGTLTQSINVKLRPRPINARPYEAK
jgi:hypothetical protein